MKKQCKILPLLVVILLSACKEITFYEPQPRGKKFLKEVPAELHGKYFIKDDDGTAQDTLTIDASGYIVGHNPHEKALLSDSLILKYYKGYYFINMNEHPEWLLRVIQKDESGNLLFMSMEDERKNFNGYLKKLSKEIKIDSVKAKDEMLYQINPSPKKLVSLIKKGYFKQTVFTKIK